MSCCNTNGKSDTLTQPQTRSAPRTTFQPRVDIQEGPDQWTIVAEVPGAAKESVQLSYEEGLLTLRADVPDRSRPDAAPLLQENPVGDFERTFRLGEGINGAGISAGLSDGVLTIRLPKAEAARPRRIEIQTQ